VVELCESALEAGADDAPTRLVLTRALLAQDRDAEAGRHLAVCAELAPGCAETFRLLAAVAKRRGDLGAATLFLREADELERRATDHCEIETHVRLATDTWDGTTMDRQLDRSSVEKTVKRRAPRASGRRALTRLERPRRLLALGTELGEQGSITMETTQEVGAFPQ